jgi:hypothetical protein
MKDYGNEIDFFYSVNIKMAERQQFCLAKCKFCHGELDHSSTKKATPAD